MFIQSMGRWKTKEYLLNRINGMINTGFRIVHKLKGHRYRKAVHNMASMSQQD
jgi:hypothetical protein